MSKKPTQTRKKDTDIVQMHRIDQRYDTIRVAIKSLGWVVGFGLVAHYISLAFGRATSLNVSGAFSLLGDFKFKASVALTGGACAWACLERVLRKRVIKRMAPYKRKYEELLDSNRSSSQLKPDGTASTKDLRE